MLKIDQQALINYKPETVRGLYDKHGGMLLGFIFDIVKDRKLAEEYLVRVFRDLSQQFDETNWDGTNSWCHLQRFTRNKLATLHSAVEACGNDTEANLVVHSSRNQYLDQLTDEQRKVFCDVYYHGKQITLIAKELNKEENLIRKTLKEAFAIMRKGGEN